VLTLRLWEWLSKYIVACYVSATVNNCGLRIWSRFIWIFTVITTVITNLQLHFWLFWTSSVPTSSSLSLVSQGQGQGQGYIATDGRSISKSWCRAPSGAHDQIFIIVWQLRYFVYAAGPRQRSLSRVRVPWISRPYFSLSVLRIPFSSPPTTSRVTVEVYEPVSTRVTGPSPLGLATIFYCLSFQTSLFVPSYDSQDHGGGIRTRLHTDDAM
jgi:hypothetical protein